LRRRWLHLPVFAFSIRVRSQHFRVRRMLPRFCSNTATYAPPTHVICCHGSDSLSEVLDVHHLPFASDSSTRYRLVATDERVLCARTDRIVCGPESSIAMLPMPCALNSSAVGHLQQSSSSTVAVFSSPPPTCR